MASEKSSVGLALAASVAVSLIFSAHYIVAKEVIGAIPIQSLAAARGIVGGVVLSLAFHRKIKRAIAFRSLLWIILVAVFGFCGNQLLLFTGLAYTSSADAALVSSTIPIVATLMAAVVGIDRFRWRRVLGSLLGLSVVSGYILYQQQTDLGDHAFGSSLIFLNVLCLCLALMVAKVHLKDTDAEVVAAGMLGLGGLGLWIAGADIEPVVRYGLSAPRAALLIAFETIVTTVLGYTLNLWALKRLSVASTTVFNYLQAPLTVLLCWVFLNQDPNWALVGAFAGVLLACAMVSSTELETGEKANDRF